MSTSYTTGESNFNRYHKPSCTESDLTTEVSILSNFQSLALDDNYSSDPSVVLKQNFSSVNSNNVTFGEFINQKPQKNKENNLAYAICQKFPPKIKKEVQAIIDYYEGQLEGQRQLFWKMTENNKKPKPKEDFSFNLECSTVLQTNDKEERINELQNRLMQKQEKIIELNKQITTLMISNTKLKKKSVSSSPINTKSTRFTRGDYIKEFQ